MSITQDWWGSISIALCIRDWTLMVSKNWPGWNCSGVLGYPQFQHRPSGKGRSSCWQQACPTISSAGCSQVLSFLVFPLLKCPYFLQPGPILLHHPVVSLPPGPAQIPGLGPPRKRHKPSDYQLPSGSGHSNINPVSHPHPQMSKALPIDHTPLSAVIVHVMTP